VGKPEEDSDHPKRGWEGKADHGELQEGGECEEPGSNLTLRAGDTVIVPEEIQIR